MRILKKLLAIAACIFIFGAVLYIGGYTFEDFATSIGLKNPADVFDSYLPDVNMSNTTTTGDNTSFTSNSNSSNSSQTNWFPDDLEFSKSEDDFLNASKSKDIVVKVGTNIFTVTENTVTDFIKWLQKNFSDGDDVSIEENSNTSNSNDICGSSNTSNNEFNNENKLVVYNTILQNKDDLQALVESIRVVDKLPTNANYDRTTFESPVKNYTLNGKKVNRNDYAWKTSKWFNEADFTYICPYTGKVIFDADDKKTDNDFGNLDYDHIVPLHSAYLRGANEWTKEQQNEYAYNQWVGVDVLNSANRSKSDKGPLEYLPAINVEDYCYSWIMICSKYDLAMTQAEIDLCTSHINDAMNSGESVEFFGGHYE